MAQTKRRPHIEVEPRHSDNEGRIASGFIYYSTPDRNEQLGRIGFGLGSDTPLWTTQWREPDDREVLAAVKALAKFHDKLSASLGEALIDSYPAYQEAVVLEQLRREQREAKKR